MSALVIGTDCRLLLTVVRGLGIEGVPVFTADSLKYNRGRFSRYSSRHFVYTSPFIDEERFFDDLLKIIEESGAKVLFPVEDEIYYLIAKNKKRFENIISIPIPDWELINSLKTKRDLLDIAKKLNILTPETWMINNVKNVLKSLGDFKYPLVIKPSDRVDGKRIFFARDSKELKKIIVNNEGKFDENDYLLQQYIDGKHFGVAYIYKSGKVICNLTYEQIHQIPISGGVPTLTRSCCHTKTSNILKNALGQLSWQGVCQADFIVDDKTGDTYLIDINPRFFSAMFQAIVSGLNFPHILYEMVLSENFKYSGHAIGERSNLWIEGEIGRFINYLTSSMRRTKPDLMRALKKIDSIEDIASKDYKPFVFLPICFFYKKLFQHSPEYTSNLS